MDISVSPISRIRVWVAKRSVGCLLLIWLAAYVASGFIFAEAYKLEPECVVRLPGRNCENRFWALVYFSFATQSTLGTEITYQRGWVERPPRSKGS